MKKEKTKKKDKTFEQIWQLEQKIFTKDCRSTKKDLKDIYDCRELLIINETGYILGSPLEEVPHKEVGDSNWGQKNTTYIWSIGILPKYRGEGHGETMLKKAIMFSPKPRISLDTTNPIMKKICIEMGFKQLTETYFLFFKGK